MLEKITTSINRVIDAFTVICLALMSVIMLLAVFFRYFLLQPIPWAGVTARYLMIWMALFGAGSLLQKKGHVAVGLFVDMLPERLKTVALLIADLVILVFAVFMGYFAIQLLTTMRVQIEPSLQINMKYVYMAFPVFSVMLILSVLNHIADKVKQISVGRGQN